MGGETERQNKHEKKSRNGAGMTRVSGRKGVKEVKRPRTAKKSGRGPRTVTDGEHNTKDYKRKGQTKEKGTEQKEKKKKNNQIFLQGQTMLQGRHTCADRRPEEGGEKTDHKKLQLSREREARCANYKGLLCLPKSVDGKRREKTVSGLRRRKQV